MSEDVFPALLVFIGAVFAAGLSGVFFRPGRWYERLAKPDWRPPNWLFGPVWTALYAMIAVSGWLVWREAGDTPAGRLALGVFALQLTLNFLWSAVMFGARRIGWALVELGALWLSIAAMIVLFHPISPTAAYLLIPYLLWASFAAALNFAVWRLNPSDGRGAATA